MKFGNNFERNQVPEWNRKYLPYKQLKALLKRVPRKIPAADPSKPNIHLRGLSGEFVPVLICSQCHTHVPVPLLEDHMASHPYLETAPEKQRAQIAADSSESCDISKNEDDFPVQQDQANITGADSIPYVITFLRGSQPLFDSTLSASDPLNKFWFEFRAGLDAIIAFAAERRQSHLAAEATLHQQLNRLDFRRTVNRPLFTSATFHRKKELLKDSVCQHYAAVIHRQQFLELNQVAIRKIIKKHDKLTGTHSLSNILELVTEIFPTAEQFEKERLDIERLYAAEFTYGSESEARAKLRRTQQKKKPSESILSLIGFLLGSSIALLLWCCVRWIDNDFGQSWPQSASVFLLYRLWLWPILGLWLWGTNVLLYNRARINFILIFEHRDSSYRQYYEIYMMAGVVTLSWSLSIVFYMLSVTSWKDSLAFSASAQPLILSAFFVCIFFCPFDTFYRDTRLSCIYEISRLFRSGFIDVTMMDFFVADQLCSALGLFEDTGFQICFLATDIWTSSQSCLGTPLIIVKISMGFLPFGMRFLQCLRRWRHEEGPHLANAGKYLTQVPVVVFYGLDAFFSRSLDGSRIFTYWTGLLAASEVVAQYYRLGWDYCRDWHVLRPGQEGFPLRLSRLYPTSMYYVAIITNFLLRHTWIFYFYPPPYPVMRQWPLAFGTLFGVLELLRRFQWNFFRIENEQINNTGAYRTTLNIPLLFENIELQHSTPPITSSSTANREVS